jgi:hypothetical protein
MFEETALESLGILLKVFTLYNKYRLCLITLIT